MMVHKTEICYDLWALLACKSYNKLIYPSNYNVVRLGYDNKCALGIVTIDKFANMFTPHPSVIFVPRSQPLLPYGKAI